MKDTLRSFFGSFFFVLFYSCHANDADCVQQSRRVNRCIGMYYIDSNLTHIDSAISLIDSIYEQCDKQKLKLVNTKVMALMIKRDYKTGFNFVNGLLATDFVSEYKKNLALKTFQALALEKEGGIAARDSVFSSLVTEIQQQLKKKPSDTLLLFDLFYTKMRYQNKKIIERDIEELKRQHKENTALYDLLKETLFFNEKSAEVQLK